MAILLTEMKIENFRGIESLTFQLDETCVLIGENNVGKSTILDALKTCMTGSATRRSAIFNEYDYHLAGSNPDPTKADRGC